MDTITEKKKVLVIEDETELLTILQIRLSHDNFEVFTASDGNAGLALANEVQPDIILLDIMMPGKDGITLLREFKADDTTCDIPIIIVTARERMEDSCIIEGASGFLTKPFEFCELKDNIQHILDKI